MRELKFRAWSPSMGKWRADWSLSTYEIVLNLNAERIDSDLVLEQYTGLKDKNGREIYEGDILVFTPKRWVRQEGNYEKNANGIVVGWPVDIYEDDDKAPPFTVEWNDCGGWYPFCDDDDGMPYPKPDRCEIIGNIHEKEPK